MAQSRKSTELLDVVEAIRPFTGAEPGSVLPTEGIGAPASDFAIVQRGRERAIAEADAIAKAIEAARIAEEARRKTQRIDPLTAFGAGFKLEHTIFQAADALLRDTYYPRDEVVPEGWRPEDNIKGYEDFAHTLLDAKTPMELQQMKESIDINRTRMTQAENGGFSGWLGRVVGTVTDPFSVAMMFLPGGAAIKAGQIGRAAGINFLAGAVADLPREYVNHYFQPLRTKEDTIAGVLSGAIFSSVIGAGAAKLMRNEIVAAERAIERRLLEDDIRLMNPQFSSADVEATIKQMADEAAAPGSSAALALAQQKNVFTGQAEGAGRTVGMTQPKGTPVEQLFANFAERATPEELVAFRQKMFERANADPKAFTNDPVRTSIERLTPELGVRIDAAVDGKVRAQVIENGEVVAAARIDRGMLDSIAVIESAKGRGIGEKLLRYLDDRNIANIHEVPDRSPGFVAIQKKVIGEPTPVREPSTMAGGGAAVATEVGGGLAVGAKNIVRRALMMIPAFQSPEGRTFMSNNPLTRWFGHALAESGIAVEGGVGMSAQQIIKHAAREKEIFNAELRQLLEKSGLEKDEFYRQVHGGMVSGMQGRDLANPQASAAVARLEKFITERWEAAAEAGIPGTFREVRNAETGVVERVPIRQDTAAGYFTRMWAKDKMEANPQRWKDEIRAAMEKRYAIETERIAANRAPIERDLAVAEAELAAAKKDVHASQRDIDYYDRRVIVLKEQLRAASEPGGYEAAARHAQEQLTVAAERHGQNVMGQQILKAEIDRLNTVISGAREQLKTMWQDVKDLRFAGNQAGARRVQAEHRALKQSVEQDVARREQMRAEHTKVSATAERSGKRLAIGEKALEAAQKKVIGRAQEIVTARGELGTTEIKLADIKLRHTPLEEIQTAKEKGAEVLQRQLDTTTETLARLRGEMPENEAEWSIFLGNTYDSIMGMRPGEHFVPISGGTPSPTKHRMRMNDDDIMQWLDDDIFRMVDYYHHSLVPKTIMSNHFRAGGDYMLADRFRVMEMDFISRRDAILADTKLSEKQQLSQIERISKEWRRDKDDLEAMRDLLLERSDYVPKTNGDKQILGAIRSLRAWASGVNLGSAGFAQLPDVARAVAISIGSGNTAQAFMEAASYAAKNITLSGELPKNRLLALAVAMDYGGANRILLYGGEVSGQAMSRMEHVSRSVAETIIKYSGMPQMTVFAKLGMAAVFSHDMVLAAQKGAKPTTMMLEQLGIHPDMWKRITDEINLHAHFDDVADIPSWDMRGQLWRDQEAIKAVELALVKYVDLAILTPTELNKPLWVSTGAASEYLGKNAATFTSTMLTATNDLIIPMIQGTAINGAYQLFGMLAMGAASYQLRNIAMGKGVEDVSDYRTMREIVSKSGVLGIFMDLYERSERVMGGFDPVGRVLEKTTGIEAGGLPTRHFNTTASGLFMGPSAGLIERGAGVFRGMAAGDADSSMHNLRMLLPGQNHFMIRRLADIAEGAIADALGGTGKYGQPPKTHGPGASSGFLGILP